MSLHVHLTHPPKPEHLAHLEQRLAGQVSLTFGIEPPQPALYDFLIDGRPTTALLTASPALRGVIIPFAGAPAETLQLLKGLPHLKLYNLHHNADSTAEFALGLLLAAAKLLIPADRIFRTHNWTPRHDPMPSFILHGKTALVLGYGAVGQRVAKMCRALGMHIIGVKRHPDTTPSPDELHTVEQLPALLPRAHVLISCLPLTDQTQGLIGERELALLPPQAILVNVGRAAVVDETALYNALKQHKLHAAALDVWYQYPADKSEYPHSPPSQYPFHELDNLVMSPHRAGGVETDEIEFARMEGIAEILNAALRGEEISNEVDLHAGY